MDTLNVTKIAAAEFQSFEYSEWNINLNPSGYI